MEEYAQDFQEMRLRWVGGSLNLLKVFRADSLENLLATTLSLFSSFTNTRATVLELPKHAVITTISLIHCVVGHRPHPLL